MRLIAAQANPGERFHRGIGCPLSGDGVLCFPLGSEEFIHERISPTMPAQHIRCAASECATATGSVNSCVIRRTASSSFERTAEEEEEGEDPKAVGVSSAVTADSAEEAAAEGDSAIMHWGKERRTNAAREEAGTGQYTCNNRKTNK
jgi:hypothetical protein